MFIDIYFVIHLSLKNNYLEIKLEEFIYTKKVVRKEILLLIL